MGVCIIALELELRRRCAVTADWWGIAAASSSALLQVDTAMTHAHEEAAG